MKTKNFETFHPACFSSTGYTQRSHVASLFLVNLFSFSSLLLVGSSVLVPGQFALAEPPDIHTLLHNIERKYNQAQSLKLDFSETYAGLHRPEQVETGVLYLRKPGRMRWDYSSPSGKIFLSDGKEIFEYTPSDRQAVKTRLKQSDDMRTPLAFLLGKLDFEKEFKSFRTRVEGEDTWIEAEPKSQNLAYTGVAFLATLDGEIRRVRFTLQDQSRIDLAFSNQRMNEPVPLSLFTFHPPLGVQVVDQGEQ
jgi:outer membrane lipoprotein carrier protein